MKSPEGVLSASAEGVAVKIENGFATVTRVVADALKAHGFTEVSDDGREPVQAAAQAAVIPADMVALPRELVYEAMGRLGVAMPDDMPANVLAEALSAVANGQAERVEFEIERTENRVREAVADELKALTDRAEAAEAQLKALTEKPKSADQQGGESNDDKKAE